MHDNGDSERATQNITPFGLLESLEHCTARSNQQTTIVAVLHSLCLLNHRAYAAWPVLSRGGLEVSLSFPVRAAQLAFSSSSFLVSAVPSLACASPLPCALS